jgi:predicted dehydrogenase
MNPDTTTTKGHVMKNPSTQRPALNRRTFLRTAAAGALAAPYIARGQVLGANDRIGVGFIGAGGRSGAHMGMVKHLKEAGEAVDHVAVCDIYRPRREKKKQQFGMARDYADHRDLLADKDVDIVCIATPDHHHGYQALDALKAGKSAYCEKPVTHWRQFELTKKLADAAAASPCCLQIGTQAMSDSAWHQMKALVKEGLIGTPLFGETGFFRTGDWGERGMRIDDPNVKPGPDLNWEAFLGDAPKREFSVDRLFRWRLFEDYAGGPVTDLYPHCLTQVVDILGVGFPEAVVALGGIHVYPYELRDVPDTFNLIAQYPEKITISVLGTQGNDFQNAPKRGAGQRCPAIRGTEGSLTIAPSNKEIQFTGIEQPGAKPPQKIAIERAENNTDLWKNLLDCARSGKKTDLWSPMSLAFRAQTVLQMAMLGHKAGKTAKFDAAKREIVL